MKSELALVKETLETILSKDYLGKAKKWPFSAEDRNEYKDLLRRLEELGKSIRTRDQRSLDEERFIQQEDSELADFYYKHYWPRRLQLRRDLAALDPGAADFLADGKGASVKDTFALGLGELLAQKAEIALEEGREILLDPELAIDVVDSELIEFEPDHWLRRREDLEVIRRVPVGAKIPKEIKDRLRELYRSHLFGNWLAVAALARSVVEFALVDNAGRFGVNPVDVTSEKKYNKSLDRLIDEVVNAIKDAGNPVPRTDDNNPQGDMHEIRKGATRALHGSKVMDPVVPIDSARSREKSSQATIRSVRRAIEFLYSARSPHCGT